MIGIIQAKKRLKGMLIIRIWEGLGNQMFQYAYARVLSQLGYSVCLDLNKAYDDFFVRDIRQKNRDVEIQNFNITLGSVDVEKIEKYEYLRRRSYIDKTLYEMAIRGKWFYNFWDESQSGDIKRIKGNCYVKGWFQNPLYCDEIREILLKEFTPKKKIKITNRLKELLNEGQAISIHIRRTDYVTIHNSLNWEYYDKAMAEIKKIYSNPVFVIFSDDVMWVKDRMPSDENCYYIDDHESLEDYEQLLVMSRCTSNIIANSTFSWWAAWLNRNNEKIIIAPKKWLGGQSKLVLKQWIIL